MTPDNPDNPTHRTGTGILRGRKPGPLISSLAGVIIVAALMLMLERKMPVLHDVLVPIYAVIGVIGFIVIARGLRHRRGKRRISDRRQAERRDTDS